MPDNEGIKTKVGVQGDKEYKQALSDISRQLTVLNTDMKASQSAFGSQADTMAGMRDKMDKLGSIYDAQREKVRLISEQLEKAEAEYGENSKQADQLRIALNKATTQMNGTKNQMDATQAGLNTLAEAQQAAGDATDSTSMTLKEAEKALKDAAQGSETLADESGKAGDAVAREGSDAQESAGKNEKLHAAMEKIGQVAGGVMRAGLEAAGAAMAALGRKICRRRGHPEHTDRDQHPKAAGMEL